jgi:hypothetical protein
MISSVSSSLATQYAPKKSPEKLDALAIKSDAAPIAKSDKVSPPRLDPSLFNKFLKYFETGDKMADIDHNGMVNVNDCMAFLNLYAAGINPFEQPPTSDVPTAKAAKADSLPDSPTWPTATAGEAVEAKEIPTPPVLYAPLTPKAEKPEFAPVLKLATVDASAYPYSKKMLPIGDLKQLLDVLS